MSFKERLARSRESFGERMNLLFKRGPKLDEDFWDDLEETLILSDLGARAADEIVSNLREQATRKALPDSYAVLDMLADEIAGMFTPADPDPFTMNPVCILFVGVNGAGKTTTVGKLAYQAHLGDRKVLIGSGDTFRAAAIEQLDVWGQRSGVEVVKRERGSDPASVCYDVVARAEELQGDLVLIDTSGRLHTSDELMRELQKVVNVTRKRADMDVMTVLVIDATTGQNGLQQAREFDKALDLDGVIMTKMDGTAKGGIAVAISHELGLPILRIGMGEGIEDLEPFDAHEYAEALFGEMRDDQASDVGKAEEDEIAPEGLEQEEQIEPELDEVAALDEAALDGNAAPAAEERLAAEEEAGQQTAEERLAAEEEAGQQTAGETLAAEVEPELEEAGQQVVEDAFEEPGDASKESFRQKMRRWFS